MEPRQRMMLVAVFIGLAAAGGVFFYVQSVQKKAAQTQVALVNVIVAKEPIPARTVIEEKMLEGKQLPEPAVTPEMIRNNQEILGKVTTSAIIVGEIIQRPKIAEKGAGMGLSFIVPHGKRALTVKVDDVLGVAGLIKPGDFVDVLSTFDIPKVSTNVEGQQVQTTESMAVTVLQNAQVLALDQMMEARPPEQDAKAAPTPGGGTSAYALVTLAVMPKEAERVHLLYQKGPVRLTLRPLREFNKMAGGGTTLSTIIGKQYFTVPVSPKKASEVKPMPSASYPKLSSLPMPSSFGMPSMPGTSMSTFLGQKFGPKQEVQVIKGTTVETVGGTMGNTGTSQTSGIPVKTYDTYYKQVPEKSISGGGMEEVEIKTPPGKEYIK